TRESADALERLVADESRDPVEKLADAVKDIVTRIATNPARFRLLLLSEASLPPALAQEHRRARVRVLRQLTEIIHAGIESGRLRPVDQHVAAFSILGMCNWVAWWYSADRENCPAVDDLASNLADLAVASLLTSRTRMPVGPGGARHALTLL